jgi:hypothetical protein
MLNQPSNPKLIIGSPRTGIIGETLVPDAPHEPAVPRSPTPSTKPNDPHLVYNQPGHKKKLTNESFPTPPSPPRATKNSPHTTIPTTQAAAAATPQAAKPASIAARPHGDRTRTRTARNVTSPSTVIDTTKPRAPSPSSTAVKKCAAANPAAQLQPKQAAIATKPHDAKLRNAKLSNVTERNTPATIASIDAAKPWHAFWTADNTTATRIADVFSGTVVKMPRDGTCLLHSLLNSLKLGDAKEIKH